MTVLCELVGRGGEGGGVLKRGELGRSAEYGTSLPLLIASFESTLLCVMSGVRAVFRLCVMLSCDSCL